jgi:hypothetical protein
VELRWTRAPQRRKSKPPIYDPFHLDFGAAARLLPRCAGGGFVFWRRIAVALFVLPKACKPLISSGRNQWRFAAKFLTEFSE